MGSDGGAKIYRNIITWIIVILGVHPRFYQSALLLPLFFLLCRTMFLLLVPVSVIHSVVVFFFFLSLHSVSCVSISTWFRRSCRRVTKRNSSSEFTQVTNKFRFGSWLWKTWLQSVWWYWAPFQAAHANGRKQFSRQCKQATQRTFTDVYIDKSKRKIRKKCAQIKTLTIY